MDVDDSLLNNNSPTWIWFISNSSSIGVYGYKIRRQQLNIGLIVGHDKESQGAVSYNGISEYQFNSFVAMSIQSIHHYKVYNKINKFEFIHKFTRNKGWDHVEQQISKFECIHKFTRNKGWDHVEQQISKFECDVTIELHFNSFFRKGATGVEVLCLKDDKASLDFSRKLASSISREYRSKIRDDDGAKEIVFDNNGFNNLNIARCAGAKISVLVEPEFLSHETVASSDIINNPLKYANIIYNAIEGLFD